ncbi:MAG: aspartate kinase [bacterium]|nr:aspartate kinase [bacterium]
MTTLVMKFGGSAVGMTIGLTQLLSIVLHEQDRWGRLLVVVSALDGVTDNLLEAAHLAQLSNRRGYRRIVANLRQRHLALIEALPLGVTERTALQADIDQMLFDMLTLCQSMSDSPDTVQPDMINGVVAIGEKLAARIVAALLRQNQLRSVAIDATDLMITDNVFGNATPNIPLTRQRITQNLLPMLDRRIIPVITGFIGSTMTGKTTVLGRGGSDYTASVLGVCIDADEIWIWTDVDGMMSADPNQIEAAHSIPMLSYDETAELAYFGARILHARMIEPLRERQIVLRVRNVFKPQQPGTLIQKTAPDVSNGLKAVTSIQGLALTAQHSGALAPVAALIDEVLFTITGSHTDVMISSQSSAHSFLCFIIPTSAGQDAAHNLQLESEERLLEHFPDAGWSVRAVSVITAIGTQIGQQQRLIADLLRALGSTHILAMAQGPGGCSFSIVTELEDGEQALMHLHDVILHGDQ